MKRCAPILLVLVAVGLAACSGAEEVMEEPAVVEPPPQARVVGDWEGRLNALGASLRIVFHVTQTESGELAATVDSPDQGATGIRASAVSFDGSAFRMEVDAIGGVYVGTLTDTGMLDGQWTQSGQTFELDMRRTG